MQDILSTNIHIKSFLVKYHIFTVFFVIHRVFLFFLQIGNSIARVGVLISRKLQIAIFTNYILNYQIKWNLQMLLFRKIETSSYCVYKMNLLDPPRTRTSYISQSSFAEHLFRTKLFNLVWDLVDGHFVLDWHSNNQLSGTTAQSFVSKKSTMWNSIISTSILASYLNKGFLPRGRKW